MKKKRIYLSLTQKGSIEKVIKELEKYDNDLIEKGKRLCSRLADIGVNAAMMTLATKGQGDASRSAAFNIAFKVEGREVNYTLSVTSTPTVTEDGRVFYPHFAWEFGAGNYFNGIVSPNPKAAELGLDIGSFPGQTHVPEPGWWYYRDENGEAVRSYGTQATMPMHTAVVEMMQNIENIAIEVFNV